MALGEARSALMPIPQRWLRTAYLTSRP